MVPEYWWPYLYQYSVGTVIFVIGLVVILRARSCVLSRRQDRFWFAVLLLGYAWYAGGHYLWYRAAEHLLPSDAPSISAYLKQHPSLAPHAEGPAAGSPAAPDDDFEEIIE